MNELSRSLIAAAREGLAPDAAVAARVRAKVAAAVGATAATGSAAAITVKSGSSLAALLKLGAVVVAIGAITGVAVLTTRDDHTPEPPRVNVTAPAADDMRSAERVVAPAEPSLVAPAPSQAPAPTPTARTKHVDLVAPPPPSTAPSASEAEPAGNPNELTGDAATARRRRTAATDDDEDGVSLSREVELIDLASTSLKKRAPHAALEAIKAYDRVTRGRGQLAEEAAAIEIEARCNMDLDATKQIERFDLKYPESAQRERIQTACFSK